MKRTRIVLAVTGAALLAGGAGTASGAGPTPPGPIDSGVVHGCMTDAAVNGSHALVLQDTGVACPRGTTAVTWNLQGAAGPQGPAGPKGDPGGTGPAGATGPAGPAGPQGPAGAKGDTGATGPEGAPGAQGPAGPQGDKGDPGATGPQGLAGPAGAPGTQGDKGDPGPQGPQGAAGPAGPAGPAGTGGATAKALLVPFSTGNYVPDALIPPGVLPTNLPTLPAPSVVLFSTPSIAISIGCDSITGHLAVFAHPLQGKSVSLFAENGSTTNGFQTPGSFELPVLNSVLPPNGVLTIQVSDFPTGPGAVVSTFTISYRGRSFAGQEVTTVAS